MELTVMPNLIYPPIKHPCGLYQIVNLIDGKRYIGSSCELKKRLKTHIKQLNSNKHHCIHLQRAYNKYGQKEFKIEILA
jgi:group I intron endonuclease